MIFVSFICLYFGVLCSSPWIISNRLLLIFHYISARICCFVLLPFFFSFLFFFHLHDGYIKIIRENDLEDIAFEHCFDLFINSFYEPNNIFQLNWIENNNNKNKLIINNNQIDLCIEKYSKQNTSNAPNVIQNKINFKITLAVLYVFIAFQIHFSGQTGDNNNKMTNK